MEIQEWLDKGATPPLAITNEQYEEYEKDYKDKEVKVQAKYGLSSAGIGSGVTVPYVDGYEFTLYGEIELYGRNLVFKHKGGYNSTNSKETNRSALFELFKQKMGIKIAHSFHQDQKKEVSKQEPIDVMTAHKLNAISTDFFKKD